MIIIGKDKPASVSHLMTFVFVDQKLGSKIARIGALQVGQVKTRLEEARRVAVTEKDAYVRVIKRILDI